MPVNGLFSTVGILILITQKSFYCVYSVSEETHMKAHLCVYETGQKLQNILEAVLMTLGRDAVIN